MAWLTWCFLISGIKSFDGVVADQYAIVLATTKGCSDTTENDSLSIALMLSFCIDVGEDGH